MYVVSMSLMLPLKETNSSFFHSWDQAYDREIKSFHDVGDVGEIWYLKVQFIKMISPLAVALIVNLH